MEDPELRELLLNMSFDELSDAVAAYAEKDMAFAKAFKDFVENFLKHESKEDARNEVNDSFCKTHYRGGRYGYDAPDWFGIMEEKEALFKKALRALSLGCLSQAVAYPLQWLHCFGEHFTQEAFVYDEEGTEFGFACDEAMRIIEKAITHPCADAGFKEEVSNELSDLAKEATVFDDYGYANLGAFAKRIKAMTRPSEEALAIIEELIASDEHGVSLEELIIQKSNILFSMGKEEEALRFLENNVCERNVCRYLLSILTEKKDYDRAVRVLEKVIRTGKSFEKTEWFRKEAEIFELSGRHDDATAAYRRSFIESSGSFEVYVELKKRIPPAQWEPYLNALMNETTFNTYYFGDRNDKAEILIAENDFQELFDDMCAIDDGFKLDFYEHYAPKLPADKQRNLIPYYMGAIRTEATTARKRDHYARVRRHISNLKELSGSDQSVAALLTEFRLLYCRRPAFIDELKQL